MQNVYDVVVLGSGAAGLTAALVAHDAGARVAVFEKASHVGGTSAWSGGMVWIPDNPHMPEIGAHDSEPEAIEYLLSMSHGTMSEDLVRAFVRTGPEMVRWLEAHTPVRFVAVPGFPDYHPELPGGKPEGGRTLECPMYSYRELGAWAERVSRGEFYVEVRTTIGETPLGRPIPAEVPAAEIERRRAANERGRGQSLVGRLLRGCLDRHIEPYTGYRATELVTSAGKISGVRFETAQGPAHIEARRGVILATGGFEWNRSLVSAFLRGPLQAAVSTPTNTGDGLIMAMKAGAALGNMREAWWQPAMQVPRPGHTPAIHMVTCERTFPRSIMVNRAGRRFTNEAANYNAFGAAFHEIEVNRLEYRNLPCWLIFDEGYLERYGFGWDSGPGCAPEWVTRAPALESLAETLRIPAAALIETVQRWNAMVASGHDDDFCRGDSANDTWWGDPALKGQRGGTLGPLDKAPFYAVEIVSSTLGTKGGPRTTIDGQVIDHDGNPIRGLYAAGNVMASPMGMTYGGAGGTLAPGMVFGYRAGRHAAAAR